MASTTTLTHPTRTPGAASTTNRDRADRVWDVGVVVVVDLALIVGLWLRHGGLDAVNAPGGTMTAIGQLSGLLGTFAVLVELGLMARIPRLEDHLGFDRLVAWHRWTGFAVVNLLVVHAVTITVGYAQSNRQSIPHQIGDFIRHYPDVLMAIVALVIFVAVGITSMRAARRRMVRERWYAVHLYVYLAVALGFAHQLSVGSDFADDRVARWWWSGLLVIVVSALVWFRLLVPIGFNLRHRFYVAHVVAEAPGVVSYYVTGRDMDSIDADAGQFFLLRLLNRDGWWRSNPFSLSATPGDGYLRFTIKTLGDHTARMQRVRPGTRIVLEGPLGIFTARRRTRARVALIAGGIGITPLRAMLDDLYRAGGDITLLYRVAAPNEILFGDELRQFVQRGVDVRVIVDEQIGTDETDRLGIPALRALVPDLASRDVYLCGPPRFIDALERRVRRIGVPRSRVHHERFDY